MKFAVVQIASYSWNMYVVDCVNQTCASIKKKSGLFVKLICCIKFYLLRKIITRKLLSTAL